MTAFSRDVLRIDAPRVADTLERALRETVLRDLRRRGAVVGVSGGIDSAVVASLATRAFGPERVVALLMPDRDSSGDALRLGRAMAEHLGIRSVVEDIGPMLEAIGCYERQAAAIRMVVPAYGEGWRCKLTLPSILEGDRLSVTRLTVADPDGREETVRMTPAAYLGLVAATNFKQRMRTMLEYHHADALGYAVVGTPNLLEDHLGFFVKQGDGASDVKPIAGLYKSQVFALAHHLGVPAEIQARTPTSDTFSLPQTQEEFYFALPYPEMDLFLWAEIHHVPAATAASVMGVETAVAERIYRDIEAKRRARHYLQLPSVLLDPGTDA